MIKQALKRVYFDTFRNLPTRPKTALAENSMGSDIIAAVFLSEDYTALKEADLCFRLSRIMTYWVGAAFAGGGSGKMWADCLFQFNSISDDDQMLLMMRDNFDFTPDLSQYDQPFDTGVEWENKHRLLPNFR